jgi:hypothetical protein
MLLVADRCPTRAVVRPALAFAVRPNYHPHFPIVFDPPDIAVAHPRCCT